MKKQSNTNLKVLLFVGITGLWSSVEMHAMDWLPLPKALKTEKRISSENSNTMLIDLRDLGPTETINNLTEVYTNIKADSAKDLSFTEVSALTQFWPRPKNPSAPLTSLFNNSTEIYSAFIKENYPQMNSLFPTALKSTQKLLDLKRDFTSRPIKIENEIKLFKPFLIEKTQKKIKADRKRMLEIIATVGFEQSQPLIDEFEELRGNIYKIFDNTTQEKIQIRENILAQIESYKKTIAQKKGDFQPKQYQNAVTLWGSINNTMQEIPTYDLSESVKNKFTQQLSTLQEIIMLPGERKKEAEKRKKEIAVQRNWKIRELSAGIDKLKEILKKINIEAQKREVEFTAQ